MIKKFQGTFTALITPFKEDKSIDFGVFGKLIDLQIENGITGIVPVGTTGESPTLSEEEQKEIIKFTVQKADKKVLVIAGTGSNSTEKTLKMTNFAKEVGADGALLVCPYYNKPTQKGIFLHYSEVAKIDIPQIIYNIKGRTGVNIETDTLMKLAELPNIVGVKEASGDLNQMKEVGKKMPEGFHLLSGDDNMTYDLIQQAGGDGVISVASNIIPRKISSFVSKALVSDFDEAKKLSDELQLFFAAMFIETNPIPVKTAISLMGLCREVFRLPLCTMLPENKEKLKEVLKNYQLI